MHCKICLGVHSRGHASRCIDDDVGYDEVDDDEQPPGHDDKEQRPRTTRITRSKDKRTRIQSDILLISLILGMDCGLGRCFFVNDQIPWYEYRFPQNKILIDLQKVRFINLMLIIPHFFSKKSNVWSYPDNIARLVHENTKLPTKPIKNAKSCQESP